MKIDKVILSCDDNKNYLDLWPYVSKICKLTLGITPILFHMTDTYSDFIQDNYGFVKKIKRIPDLPVEFQSQIYRLYGTKFFMDETCLISDIDMFIFNREYFLNNIKKYDDNCFISFLSDAYDLSRPETHNMWALNRIPMCYNLAKGKIFYKLLDLSCDFNEFAEKIFRYNFGYEVPTFHKDEVFLGKMLFRNLSEIEIVKLKREINDVFNIPRRLEKKNFYDYNNQNIINGYYVDCHIPNDWKQNMEIFEQIINDILIFH